MKIYTVSMTKHLFIVALMMISLSFSSCAANSKSRAGFNRMAKMASGTSPDKSITPEEYQGEKEFSGKASYYGKGFDGKKTASGDIFDQDKLTCAHRTLPFGSKLEVTSLKNGKSVVVTVNDRGPFHKDRVLDLSTAAAKQIGLDKQGTGQVKVKMLN